MVDDSVRTPGPVRVPDGILALCGLALVAGVIHVVATVEHVGISWELGVFFALVGAGQLLVAWRIYRWPRDRRMLVAAAVGSLLVASLWIWSRTTGVPFGPDAGEVSSVGVADTISTLLELVFAALAVVLLRRPARPQRRLAWLSSGLGVRVTYALLSSTLMIAAMGGHQH